MDLKGYERGAIKAKRNKGHRQKKRGDPIAEEDLMNRNDADIVSTFNSEIEGYIILPQLRKNVRRTDKYYYMWRFSMLKTLAGKHRTKSQCHKEAFSW